MRLAALLAAAFVSAISGAAEPMRPVPLLSGSHFLGEDLRALERDDFANPGMFAVANGAVLWAADPAGRGKPCAACHGEAEKSMKGVAASYPKYDAGAGRVVNLAGRIDLCQRTHQGGRGFEPESPALLALDAYLSYQSRGAPIAVSVDGPSGPAFQRGRDLYRTRIGQLNLACAHCHDASWGKTLLSETVSQGHPDGWPAYRLEWQGLGSLQRRLRACFQGVRAEPPAYGSGDLVALELFLSWRAQGLALRAPGIRR